MLRKPSVLVSLVTTIVILYAVSPQLFPDDVVIFLFLLLPFLVLYMACVILRYGSYNQPELGEGEEWGYQDRDRKSL